MSFDFSTLITDRNGSDLDILKALVQKPMSMWTAEEAEQFNAALMKGSYDYTDLNRVTACMDYLNEQLTGMGYQTGYQRIKVPHTGGGGGGSALPEGYTQLHWIESTGTQWVNTQLPVDQNTRVVMDCKASEIISGGSFPFGSRESFQSAGADVALTPSQVFYHYGPTYAFADFANTYNRLLVDANKNVATFVSKDTGLQAIITRTEATFTAPHPLVLFSTYNGGSVLATKDGGAWVGRVYSCQIYQSDDLAGDYIPCVSPSGVVGLYDLVSESFFGNSGSSAFLAGPPVVELPIGYTQLHWIESTGTQYIDTGFIPNQDTKVEIQCVNVSNSAYFYGAATTYNENAYEFYANGTENYEFNYHAEYKLLEVPAQNDKIHAIQNKNNVLFNLNGTVFHVEMTYGLFSAPQTLTIFGIHRPSSVIKSASRLIKFKVWDNDNLIFDYIPCVDPLGTVGLYDLITAKFYGNSGSGVFTTGPVVSAGDIESGGSDSDSAADLDPHFWYEQDVPTVDLMAAYLANVAALRAVLVVPNGTPEAPATLDRATYTQANQIETILDVVNLMMLRMMQAWFYCGELYCGEV